MNKLVNRLVIMSLTMLSCAAVSAQEVTVRFNLNYKTREKAPESLTLKQNNALKLQDKPLPERPGYRFAGWYTDKACTREWLFGTKSSGWMQPAVDSMAVTSSMTLYARWASPVHIKDAKGLDSIRKDLQGWYVLDNDIDLSSYEDWNPIGTYEADYEFADGEWWSTAFKGRLDGNGHAIKNLSITRLDQAKKALFGTMANGEIHDLILESPRIVLKGENPYVAPLVGMMKEDTGRQCLVENVRVNHAEIDLEVRNDTGAFVSATGLSGGTWNGTISRCAVNGSIKVLMADNGGGELYVGGFTGEPYCMTQDCVSDMDIEIVYDRGKAEGGLRSFIGGLQAGATEIRDCQSYGTIRLSGDNGKGDISVGGLIGSERYGKVADSQSYVNIYAEGVQNLRVGGIAGEFSSQYGMIGALSGVKETSIEHCFAGGSFRAKDVKDLVRGAICGSGKPETLNSWGQTMEYRLENCTYSFSDETEKNDFMDAPSVREREMNAYLDELMSRMTLQEKIGQLNVVVGGDFVSGESFGEEGDSTYVMITEGTLGGFFGFNDVRKIKTLQQIAIQKSRLHIPLIFGFDVIHGYDLSFPIPLAMASSWNMDMIERSARTAAKEASADGVHWVFSPMVDIAHDARWGRVAEGAGEDPYLGGEIAKAMVRGYQGTDNDMRRHDNVMACVKHYALYGGAEAGRDYNTVDMSRQRAFNEYMYPYQAAVEQGAGSFMSSFNEFEGQPATVNKYLLDDVLRKQWGFDGFVVTDYQAIMECTNHGIGDALTVGSRALDAGIDMDMMSFNYVRELETALEKGLVSMEQIDRACRRILEAKYKLGLFDDPYRYCDEERSRETLGKAEFVQQTREAATETFVLLKNEKNILPLSKDASIALIGPMVDRANDMVGSWSGYSKSVKPVSILEGFEKAVGHAVPHATGSWLVDSRELETVLETREMGLNRTNVDPATIHARSEKELLDEALAVAAEADILVAVLGENFNMNGEGSSRANPDIPGPQQRLLEALVATGKPVVLLLVTGRPLIMPWAAAHVSSILNVWFPGIQGGHAVADVVFGDVNPSGKLTMSFPRSLGQLPYSYNHKNTGRPWADDDFYFPTRSNYMDVPNGPLYPFGFGLSYTEFEYSDFSLDADKITLGGKFKASVTVTNTGKREGREVVQLYIRDIYATSTRPVQELKRFEKVSLAPGESRRVEFELSTDDLKYYNHELEYVCEPGDFEIMVGPDSKQVEKLRLTVE